VTGALTELFTCTIATPIAGTYTITAAYSGDLHYASVPASPVVGGAIVGGAVIVSPATPVNFTVAPSPSPILGGTVTFTATVTGVTGAATPYGSVSWAIGGQSNSCASKTGPLAGTYATQTVFTCTVNATTAGDYTASATYSGDTNYTGLAAVVSTPLVTIAHATPVVAVNGTGTGVVGSTMVFTATVKGVTGSVAPTGNVQWIVSATGNASGVNSCSSTPASTTNGLITTFTCNIVGTQTGTYTVSASYLGDSNYLTANSATGKTLSIASTSSTRFASSVLPYVQSLRFS
jgi:hypothetical protein